MIVDNVNIIVAQRLNAVASAEENVRQVDGDR